MFRESSLPRFLLGSVLIAVLFSFVASPRSSAAENPPSHLLKKKQILSEQLAREEERLASLRKEEDLIRQELQQVQIEQEKTQKASQQITSELNSIARDRDSVEVQLEDAQGEAERIQAELLERLVALYKARRSVSAVDYLYKASSATDVLKRAHYLEAVARYDVDTLDELSRVIEAMEKNQQELEALTFRYESQQQLLKDVTASLDRQKLKSASLLRAQREQARLQERSLAKLKRAAEEVEGMIRGIIKEDGTRKPEEKVEPSENQGILARKGSLNFPVTGTVIQNFGKHRHKEFSDVLFSKGIEMLVEPGVQVKTVAAGKVLFRDTLPGYGNVCIVDHGSRHYTLYGRLKDITVGLGEELETGGVVGNSGAPDSRGRNFYFELRIQGKASDPEPFFRDFPKG